MASEVWSFIETSGTGLHRTAVKVAAETARLGDLLGEKPCGIVVGADGQALGEQLGAFGLQKLYMVKTDAPADTPESYARAIERLVSRQTPTVLLFAATALGSEVAARVAARLGSGLISHCVDFAKQGEELVARKAAYDGRAHMTLAWSGPVPHVATVEPEAMEAVENKVPAVEVVEEAADIGPLKTAFLRRWKADPRQLDLTEANFVIGVGRPIIGRAEELNALREKAERLGAVFGASRPVIDAGLLPREKQIGASGRWLGADVYIACGISGSTYHMMGIRKVRHLIAINTDRDAPIFKSAELRIVGDLFEVLRALENVSDARGPG